MEVNIKPAQKSSIRSREIINKARGDEFDFGTWIRKYIVDADNITIQDGYICSDYEIQDLKYILRNVKKDAKKKYHYFK